MRVHFNSYDNWKTRANELSALVYEIVHDNGRITAIFQDSNIICEVDVSTSESQSDYDDYVANFQTNSIKAN